MLAITVHITVLRVVRVLGIPLVSRAVAVFRRRRIL
jgi:hypothetical protein